jgi:hypothetical protein
MGDTYLTAGISFNIAFASSAVRVGTVPAPNRSPPLVELPDKIMSMFDPILAICSAIRFFAPEPTAIMAITAPTPMMIPNIVKAERILLTIRALSAIRRLARSLVIDFLFASL